MFSSLSNKQKEIVFEKLGKFVVRACPGSGKTYSVAARLAHRLKNWEHKQKGIAALSFTNAAWQEIDHQLERHFNTSIAAKYPHFLGTLDSFINQYIFLPFGHLVMGCQKRPTLVGEPHNSWNYCPYKRCYEQYFDDVSYNIDDSLIYPQFHETFFFCYTKILKNDGTESEHATNLRDIKQKFWKEGYANQRDANYFAVKTLEKYPDIAKALVARFPEVIIDEAQDTTEVQARLIDILIENGLNDIMLIGDPDQAIFEWNNARPELFNQKFEAWKESSIELNENRRSSQKICNFTVKLTSMSTPTTAIDAKVKDSHLSPEIVSCDHNNQNSVQETIRVFVEKCKQNSIDTKPENVAVLFRSKDFVNTIFGVPTPKGQPLSPWVADDAITRDVAKAKFLIDNCRYKEGYRLLEKSFIKVVLSKNQCLDEDIQARINEIGFIRHRKDVYKIASLLPPTKNVDIRTWITNAKCALKGFILFRINEDVSTPVRNLFQKEILVVSDEYRLGTVHSVKGETFDAVLLFLKQKGAKEKHYKTLLGNQTKTNKSEELRIVYVAITRPRKLLMIAVPNQCKSSWDDFFKEQVHPACCEPGVGTPP